MIFLATFEIVTVCKAFEAFGNAHESSCAYACKVTAMSICKRMAITTQVVEPCAQLGFDDCTASQMRQEKAWRLQDLSILLQCGICKRLSKGTLSKLRLSKSTAHCTALTREQFDLATLFLG